MNNEHGSGIPDEDSPPYSRLFVACSKTHTEEALREVFSTYGDIEYLYTVKDSQTKDSRGIAFVKFRLSSSAARAQENVDKTCLEGNSKPISVCIASSKVQQKNFNVNDSASRSRLYVVLPKGSDQHDLEDAFSHFADYQSSYVIREKGSMEHKGFGFVCFSKASSAAIAMENCNESYHAVIAEPKESARGRLNDDLPPRLQHSLHLGDNVSGSKKPLLSSVPAGFPTPAGASPTRLFVKVNPSVTQDQLSRICNLPPGMLECRLMYSSHTGVSRGFAFVTYASADAARYAKSRLHNLEYPIGSSLGVKYAEEQSKLAASTDGTPIGSTHDVSSQPAHSSDTSREDYEQQGGPTRVFFVCTPSPPPVATLRSVFGRFGDLDRLWLVGTHNYGYAVFSDAAAANRLVDTLNEVDVAGCRMKIVLAHPPREDRGDEPLSKKSRR